MQKEILTGGPLLNEKGNLVEAGYSRMMLKEYDRKKIKAGKIKIKEWDYYLIYNKEYAVALTFDDNSYMGLNSVSIIDLINGKEKTVSPMKFFTWGKRNLPSSSLKGDIVYKDKVNEVIFKFVPEGRKLIFKLKKYHEGKDFECNFLLIEEPKESMVIHTPFEKEKHFYYNQKIVGFVVEGYFKVGDYQYDFSKEDTRAILDWGRGVWTRDNVWYWGAGAGVVDGHEVGFNIGYGFGDTSAASENAIFYDGKLHKLEDVTFNIPQDENGKYLYLNKWTFTSSDGRFEMDFEPIINRASLTDVKIIMSDQNQIFGRFTGTMVLDDGTKIELKDFIGFAERVHNKW